MSHQHNIRRFILKIFLCLSGLLIGFSILTETAFLQNTTSNTAPAALNTATPKPTPKKKNYANTNSNPANTADISNMVIEPVPTPLPANTIIRGKVFFADTGRPVKRSSIMLMQDKGFGGPGSAPSGLTDNEGNFQIKNVRAGTYFAMINAPGVVSPLAFVDFSKLRGRSEEEAFENAFDGFEKIIVDGISDLEVQIPARRGGAVGGRVMYDDGDAAIGVKVEILRKVKDKFMPVIPNFSSFFSMMMGNGVYQTDDRGVYRFSGLPAGEYIVKVTENTSHSEGGQKRSYNEFEIMFGAGNSLLSLFYPDVYETKSAQILNVELGQEISEINMTIPSRNLFKVEGKIVSRKDKSPVKAKITIKREGEEETFSIFNEFGRREQNSLTDENGNWKFKELPKGNYKLVIEPIQTENEYREAQGDYSYNSNISVNAAPRNSPPKPKLANKVQEIKLEDRDLSEMVIELGYGATIAGTIEVENSRELPQTVIITAVNTESELNVSDSVSNYGSSVPTRAIANTNAMRAASNVIRSMGVGSGDNTPDNSFKLENVTEGKTDIFIHVNDDDFYVKSAKADGIDLLAGTIELKDGDALKNVRIILAKDVGTLKGKVVNDKNETLKNTDFLLIPTDAARRKNSTFIRSVKSDLDGEFETKLAPMEYAVVFIEPESFPRRAADIDKWFSEAIKDAQKVTIEAGRTENLTAKKIKK